MIIRTQARVRSSGRVVSVLVENGVFYVLRPLTGRDAVLRAITRTVPVAGPFEVGDPRFDFEMEMAR